MVSYLSEPSIQTDRFHLSGEAWERRVCFQGFAGRLGSVLIPVDETELAELSSFILLGI